MAKTVLALAAFGALLACSSPEAMSEDAGLATARAQANGASATATRNADNAGAYSFEDNEEVDGGERTFAYSWPKEVAAIPALAGELDSRRTASLAEQKEYWTQSLADCPPDAVSCRNAQFEVTWQVVADTPRFLSLSSNLSTYTGGAHGNYGRGSLVWDREAELAMEPTQFFTSTSALGEAVGEKVCAMLNAERAKRRGEPIPTGSEEWPNQCVSMEETVVFLGSSDGEAFDRLGLYYGPYVAGSYAEGDFEFTLPVTAAVMGAVKDEYRDAFTPAK